MNNQQIIKEKIQALQYITKSNNIQIDNMDLNEFTVDNNKYYIVLNEQELQQYFFDFLLEINETMQMDGLEEKEKLYIINNCIVDNQNSSIKGGLKMSKYKKGTLLKQRDVTGFVCDTNGSDKLYPIMVIWDSIKNPICYNEKWLNDEFNHVKIIQREEYERLINRV